MTTEGCLCWKHIASMSVEGDRDIRARHESIAKISSGLNHLWIPSAGQTVWRFWVSAVNMGLISGLTELSPPGVDHRFRLLFFRHWRSRCLHIRLGMTLLSGNGTFAARKSLIMSRSSASNCLGGKWGRSSVSFGP